MRGRPNMRHQVDRKPHDRYGYSSGSGRFDSGSEGRGGYSSGYSNRHNSNNSGPENFCGESNHFTEDQGYNTAATIQSRTQSTQQPVQPTKPVVKGIANIFFTARKK